MKPLPFNQVLRTVRLRLGLTQEEFGRRAGISGSTVYSFESGRRELSEETLTEVKRTLIQCLADAERAEREERERRLSPLRSISDQVANSEPELRKALEQYCIGVGGRR